MFMLNQGNPVDILLVFLWIDAVQKEQNNQDQCKTYLFNFLNNHFLSLTTNIIELDI